ncbi:hypothetical protein [Agaribacterium sp. ZY112]|uniref:hypothetical protein n=1 Tax=Agaribacterium sp. ZY112 TaxID=3233574 RepID=UPI003525A2E6
MRKIKKQLKFGLLISSSLLLMSCSQPQVYGSITMSKGFNSYNGYNSPYYGGSGGYGSVTIGGRIR